jgi:hypothetical protein
MFSLAADSESEAGAKIDVDALTICVRAAIAYVKRADRSVEAQEHAAGKNGVVERDIL